MPIPPPWAGWNSALRNFRSVFLAVLWMTGTIWSNAVSAADAGHPTTKGLSADAAAKELSNPAGSLASLSNNLLLQTYKGDLPDADDQDA
jgi:hypothetical protein